MVSRNRVVKSVSMSLVLALVWILSGCSERPNPIRPLSGGNDPGGVTIIERAARGKITSADCLIDSMRFVRGQSGTLTVGNETIGYSSLTVGAESLPQGVDALTITMKVWTAGPVMVDLGPEGTEFDSPVGLRVSYQGAAVDGMDENSLHVYYHNVSVGSWDPVSGAAEPAESLAVGQLGHFSQYAVGSEE